MLRGVGEVRSLPPEAGDSSKDGAENDLMENTVFDYGRRLGRHTVTGSLNCGCLACIYCRADIYCVDDTEECETGESNHCSHGYILSLETRNRKSTMTKTVENRTKGTERLPRNLPRRPLWQWTAHYRNLSGAPIGFDLRGGATEYMTLLRNEHGELMARHGAPSANSQKEQLERDKTSDSRTSDRAELSRFPRQDLDMSLNPAHKEADKHHEIGGREQSIEQKEEPTIDAALKHKGCYRTSSAQSSHYSAQNHISLPAPWVPLARIPVHGREYYIPFCLGICFLSSESTGH